MLAIRRARLRVLNHSFVVGVVLDLVQAALDTQLAQAGAEVAVFDQFVVVEHEQLLVIPAADKAVKHLVAGCVAIGHDQAQGAVITLVLENDVARCVRQVVLDE
ncbi:hypothetical protein D3C81_2023020 [compost metagenome]